MTIREGESWDAKQYDQRIGYVSSLGADLVDLLKVRLGEKILDLGCGTGDLAEKMNEAGAKVWGIDYSPDMIEKARIKYPHLVFNVANAERFKVEEQMDAVFSNAALHWMKDPQAVLQCVWESLRPGGRFVAEFGGKGNVAAIYKAITEVMAQYGYLASERNPWYFPSLGEYAALLEAKGFHVEYAVHFSRPTAFYDGERGLRHWLDAFSASFFAGIVEAEKLEIYNRIENHLRPILFNAESETWFGDYVRVRFMAVKP
jgi:trans-aconitate methyltransferase